MSEDALLKARTDGARAGALLQDETLQTAFQTIRQAYSDRLFSTTIDQTIAREKLYMAARVLTEVESHLQAVFDGGKLAEAELNRLINEAEAKKKWEQVR